LARYVALLRAVNVGGKSVIKMADLRARVEALGYEDVSTYIQTGNVLLTAHDPAGQVGDTLGSEFGTRVFVLTPAQLRKAAEGNPLREKGWRSHLLFCDGRPKLGALEEKGGDQYRFAAKGKVLYFAFPDALAGKRRSLDFERLAGVVGTGRSAKVVDELLERL
jgi:uncharacterized protein (DUF1697 family)